MTIRSMTRADLDQVLEWAADEGWNPGHDDAAAFFASDPDGFLINEVDGQLASAISVVNHTPEFAFLGLYLCRPAFRGQGHGLAVWTAGMAHAGDRCVGLDGVPAQQSNYATSGFSSYGKTVRYSGRLSQSVPEIALVADADLDGVCAYDAQATGVARRAFARAWFTNTSTRQTLQLAMSDGSFAFATMRQCREGYKVGPFFADTAVQTQALLAHIADRVGAAPVYIDVPADSPLLAAVLEDLGFVPVFETARMYTRPPPQMQLPSYYGVATLELG